MAPNQQTQQTNDVGDILTEYGTDPALEQDGVWSPDFRAGIEMKIRSSQSKEVRAAQKRVDKRCEPFWKVKQDVPDRIVRKNQIDLAVAAVVDWRQRTARGDDAPDIVTATINYAGTPLDASPEHKETVFGDPRLWSLCLGVIAQMNEIDRFKIASQQADVGNSPAPSGPVSSSAATATA